MSEPKREDYGWVEAGTNLWFEQQPDKSFIPRRGQSFVSYEVVKMEVYRTLEQENAALRERVRALEQERDKFSIALHSLTPGGSEYANDAEACVKVVREIRHQQHKVILSFKKQRDTLAAKVQ